MTALNMTVGFKTHKVTGVESLVIADGKISLADKNGVSIRDFNARNEITIYIKGQEDEQHYSRTKRRRNDY